MKTLPEDFIKYTQELMGEELFLQLKQGITEGEAPTSIRLNPFKCKEGEDAPGEPIPWCPSTGRYLSVVIGPFPSIGCPSAFTTRPSSAFPTGTSTTRPVV